MDLLEELESEQQHGAPDGASASAVEKGDFVQRHIRHLQTQLKKMWTAKQPNESVVVPYMWLFAQLLRLVEQYPDGLTDAILLTEIMTKLQQREYANRKSGVANEDQSATQALAKSDENAVIEATLLQTETHRLTMSVKAMQSSSIQMFLHQRFRACIQLLQSMHIAPKDANSSFPFQTGREIAFTNVKLMERRENGSHQEEESPMPCLLPTTYMALQLQELVDQCFLMYSISLPQLHELAGRGDSPQLQQCIINAKVLDIGAVRPNKTIFHVQRQVILLGELDPPAHGGQHAMMILWDDQVALSRLFHVGERLTLVYPYIHLCGADDVELGHIANENASQRSLFYMEYGSATVLFRSPVRQTTGEGQSLSRSKPSANATSERLSSRSIDPTRIEDIAADSNQFTVHGHVASIRVAHGLPLLAAFFHAYYDQKTEHATKTMLAAATQDRTLVASYHFVVLLKLYNAESKQLLAVEVTGASAQTALRLEIGQSVLLEGLIAVDLHGDESIRSRRDSKCAPAETHWAFENAQYTQVERTASSSSTACSKVVALCSDWTHLFGIQSIFTDNARLTLLNATPGLMTTTWARDQALLGSQTLTPSMMAMTVVQVTLHLVGWLVPSDPATRQRTKSPVQCDDKCDKAGATVTVHRFCSREIDRVPSTTQRNEPKWQCLFCNEMFSSMDETMQAFGTMLVSLDFGLQSDQVDHQAIVHGDLLEALFEGVTADDYAQLNIQAKRDLLLQASGREYTALLSRCIPRCFGSYDHTGVELRIDMLQPVDAFAGAQTLSAKLRGPSRPR